MAASRRTVNAAVVLSGDTSKPNRRAWGLTDTKAGSSRLPRISTQWSRAVRPLRFVRTNIALIEGAPGI